MEIIIAATKTSPILIVNGKVVSVGMPGHSKITELKEQL
jgi:hypothetical protein